MRHDTMAIILYKAKYGFGLHPIWVGKDGIPRLGWVSPNTSPFPISGDDIALTRKDT